MNVNDMVNLFNRTIKNILRNVIPHETITCDHRDPPWINSSIRRLILKILILCLKIRHISALKEATTTIKTFKIFNPFRNY